MDLKITMTKAQETLLHNCGVRINLALGVIAVLTPLWPSLREFLPPDIYGYSFVGLTVLNAVLHYRTPTATADAGGSSDAAP